MDTSASPAPPAGVVVVVDKDFFSFVAHTVHVYLNPIPASKMDRVLSLVSLSEGDRVCDLGCGKAAVAARVAEIHAARRLHIDAVDHSQRFLAAARELVDARAAQKPFQAEINLRLERCIEYPHLGAAECQLVVCLGASHAVSTGGLVAVLDRLASTARPGGFVMFGEMFWRKPPSSALLDVLGIREDYYRSHYETMEAGRDVGLDVVYSCVADENDFDVYEGLYLFGVEAFCRENPGDERVPEMRNRIRNWHSVYQRLGRAALGFGLYLFVKRQ